MCLAATLFRYLSPLPASRTPRQPPTAAATAKALPLIQGWLRNIASGEERVRVRDPRACARGWWLVIVGVLLLVVTTGAPVVAQARPAAAAPVPDPTIVAGDLPLAQPADPWLGGKRDAAALSTCTSGVPLMSKLGYLNTGADPADSRFAVRGGTFRLGFVTTAPVVSSVVLLGDGKEQSTQAVASLRSAAFASCFSKTAPPECAADHAQCLGVVVRELPTPIVGDGLQAAVAIHALVIEEGTVVPVQNTLTLSIVQVGTAVGILATLSLSDQQLPETLRIHLRTLLAQRMKGLPLGVDAPSPPLAAGTTARRGADLGEQPGIRTSRRHGRRVGRRQRARHRVREPGHARHPG